MKYLILVLFASFILLTGCTNRYDNLLAAHELTVPVYTETGANTFGCLVNGAPWANFGDTYEVQAESFGGTNVPNKVQSTFYYDNKGDSTLNVSGEFTIQRYGKTTMDQRMTITIPKSGNLKGVHLLDSLNGLNGSFDFEHLLQYSNSFYSAKRNPFTVVIYKDSIAGTKHIVSGKFFGTLYHTPNFAFPLADSVIITGGVFDVTLGAN